jgi:hypothetical protein
MAKQNRRIDFVRQLITGNFVTVKNEEGKDVREFRPSVRNENISLKEISRNNPNLSKQQILESTGQIQPALVLDKSVFKKSDFEKKELKRLKFENKFGVRKAGFNPKFRLNVSMPQILVG